MDKYVTRQDGVLIQSMDKQEVEEFVDDVQDLGDIAISDIVETNRQKPKKIWVGTSAEYEALQNKDKDTVYFVTGDVYQHINNRVAEIESSIEDLEDDLDSDLLSLKSQVETLVHNFRDENCAELGWNDDGNIQLSPITSYTSRTATISRSYTNSWSGIDNWPLAYEFRIYGLSKYSNFHLTFTAKAESFVSAQKTVEFDITVADKVEGYDYAQIRTGVFYISGGTNGTGNFRLDNTLTVTMTGQF